MNKTQTVVTLKQKYDEFGYTDISHLDVEEVLAEILPTSEITVQDLKYANRLYFISKDKNMDFQLLEDMEIGIATITNPDFYILFTKRDRHIEEEFFAMNLYYQMVTPLFDDKEMSDCLLKDELGMKMFADIVRNNSLKHFERYKKIVADNKKRNFKLYHFPKRP